MRGGFVTWIALCGLGLVIGPGCGDDAGSAEGNGGPNRDGGVTGEPDAFYPVVEASDPCSVAGYVFDGESDCDVVRCPELSCECEPAQVADAGASFVPLPAEQITLSACVPARGCLSLVDCER